MPGHNPEVRTVFDTWTLVFGLIFSSIGLGYFIYGKKRAIVVTIFLFASLQVAAQSRTQYTIVGAGAISCGKYLSYKGLEQGLAVTWTQGFLSGMNTERFKSEKKIIFLPEYESVKAYMDKYCKENPQAMYLEGTKKLSEEVSR